MDHTITVPPHWAGIEEVVCYVEAQLGIDTELTTRGGFRAGGGELHDFHCATDQPSVARALQTARVMRTPAEARGERSGRPREHTTV